MLALYLKPFQTIFLIGLTSLVVALATLMQLKVIGGRRVGDVRKAVVTKYDARFLKALEALKKAYASGVKYRNSATIREMLRQLASKFPDQESYLSSIRSSMEGHAYGGAELSEDDFKKYSKLPHLMLPTRLPRGLPK